MDWLEWLKARDGTQVPARAPGDGKIEAIEDAPGSYVKVFLELFVVQE